MKRLLSLIFALLLVFSAAACGSSPTPEDTDAVMAALEKFSACKSFTMVQVTECLESIDFEGEKLSYNSHNETELSLIVEPALQLMSVNTTRVEGEGEYYEQFTASYVVPEGSIYTEYFTDGTVWYKSSSEDDSLLASINADAIADTFYADKLSYRKAGSEQLESGKAVRYDGKLAGEDLLTMLVSYGYLNNVTSMSENQQKKIADNLLKDLKGLTVSVWVDEVSGYPVRFEIDMSDILKDVEDSISKTLGDKASDSQYSITDCTISMTVKDFDAVGEIILPPEAASASIYEATE